jgi:hypothetical protein
MRLDQIQTRKLLTEGLDSTSVKTVLLWESVGNHLIEANLTPDQITQLFTDIESGATAAGGNRTLVGKGKDATMAVNKAWEDLKTKMQDSGPIENFDQKISDALSKIGMGAKDPKFNGEVNKWVQKYRDFAEKNPVAQGAIYATLIALAGISGAGIAGAATLGLLKLADKVLQGERFTSAAYSGAKTGALAYGASKIGDMVRGEPKEVPSASNAAGNASSSPFDPRTEKAVNSLLDKYPPGEYNYVDGGGSSVSIVDQSGNVQAVQSVTKTGMSGNEFADYVSSKSDTAGSVAKSASISATDSTATVADTANQIKNAIKFQGGGGIDYNLVDLKRAAVAAAKESGKEAQTVTDAIVDAMTKQAERVGTAPSFQVSDEIRNLVDSGIATGKGPFAVLKNLKVAAGESINFNSIQIETIIEWCDLTPAVMLTEGPLDAIKKGAAAAGGAIKKGAAAVGAKAAKVGKNMTTKVTADKLNSAWKKAGSPTDSDAIANILRQQGVDDKVLAPVYKTLGAKLPAAPAAPAAPAPKTGQTPGATGGQTGQAPAPKTGQTPGATGGQTGQAPAPMDFKGIQQAVAKLSPADAKTLVTHIDSLSKTAPAAQAKPAAAAPNASAQPAQANAAPNANPAAQDATAPAQGQAPAAPNKNAAAGDTFEKAKGDIRKAQSGTKPIPPKAAADIQTAIAKLAKGDKESGVFAAQKIMNLAKAGVDISKQQQAWVANAKAGERFLTQSVYFEISKMLREHNLSWSDLGVRVHLLEGTNKMFGVSYI